MTKDNQNPIEDYIWRGPKVNGVQEEIRLVDMPEEKLQKAYDHCMQMLYNENPRLPGRLTLVKIIEDQIQRCRAELLVRWLRAERHYTYQNCYEDIRTLIANNKEVLDQAAVENMPISTLMAEIPNEYKRVPIGLVLKAAMYSLGMFDTSHITLNFIIRLGIWLTPREMQTELFERDPETGKAVDRREIIKQREGLNPAIRLELNPTGLTYAEFHQMNKLPKDKYETFTTPQLKVLSEKVLYRFQLRCEEQAKQWQDKVAEILEVAKYKGFNIVTQDK